MRPRRCFSQTCREERRQQKSGSCRGPEAESYKHGRLLLVLRVIYADSLLYTLCRLSASRFHLALFTIAIMLFQPNFLVPIFVLGISGLEVAPNSNCSLLCMTDPSFNSSNPGSSFTHTDDLVCNDWELSGPNSSETGRKFLSCISCESTGSHFDQTTSESDIDWFLCTVCSDHPSNDPAWC